MIRLKAILALAVAVSAASLANAQTAPTQTSPAPNSAAPNSPGKTSSAKPHAGGSECFYLNELESNRAMNDRTVLFRVSLNEIYRLDFANRCSALTYPDPKLIITPFGGSEIVCHAIDLDIKVADQGPGSIPMACIPTSLHRLTAAEIAAIPKKDLP